MQTLCSSLLCCLSAPADALIHTHEAAEGGKQAHKQASSRSCQSRQISTLHTAEIKRTPPHRPFCSSRSPLPRLSWLTLCPLSHPPLSGSRRPQRCPPCGSGDRARICRLSPQNRRGPPAGVTWRDGVFMWWLVVVARSP